MRLRKRQAVYGAVIGISVYVVGFVICSYAVNYLGLYPDTDDSTHLIWLSANFVQFRSLELGSQYLQKVDLLAQNPQLKLLRLFPPLLFAAGALLLNDVIGGTRRLRHTVENSLWLLAGYVPAGLYSLAGTNARPGATLAIYGGGLAIFALAIGSAFLSRATPGLPLIGITSLGTILLVGLLALVAGVWLIDAIYPLVAYAGACAIGGGLLCYAARNAPT